MSFPRFKLFTQALGRSPSPGDAIAADRVLQAETRLGFRLPEAMTDFYQRAGNAPELQEHNRLHPPESLVVEDGYVVFMEENQVVVEWGVAIADVESDPIVWQRPNEDGAEWFSEEMTFSEFIVRNLAFVRGVDVADA